MALRAQKETYLKRRYKLEKVYGKYEIITHCEMCEKEMPLTYRISKYLVCYGIAVSGEFHHDGKGGKGELHLYCYTCHKRIHGWGVIQRWLKKIGKNIDDLPDASKTNPMMPYRERRWW